MQAESLTLQACGECGRLWHTPMPSCPFCAATAVRSETVAGRGKVYSWVTVHRSLETPSRPVPYTIATVDLDAGARVFGRFEGAGEPCANDAVICVKVDHDNMNALTFRRP